MLGTECFDCLERATFVIDGQGIVRGCAEGVLNNKGHLRYAESWLARIESEKAFREQSTRELQQFQAQCDHVDPELQSVARQEALPSPVPKYYQQSAVQQPLQPSTRLPTHKRNRSVQDPAVASLAAALGTHAPAQAVLVEDRNSPRTLDTAATPSATSTVRNGVLSSRLEPEPPSYQNVDELTWNGSESA